MFDFHIFLAVAIPLIKDYITRSIFHISVSLKWGEGRKGKFKVNTFYTKLCYLNCLKVFLCIVFLVLLTELGIVNKFSLKKS